VSAPGREAHPGQATARPPGALQGVRVLDFSWALAGPFATLQLADLGAEVVRVESPTLTEKERGFGPHVGDVSTYFFSVNRGKLGVCIDLKNPGGQEVARRLACGADVLVESFRPGTMDRLGLGHAALSELNPRLIYASLSGFGQTGPYSHLPAVDAVAQGMGGTMSLNGWPDRPPLRVGVSIADLSAGLYLTLGILAALRARDRTGLGQRVDISLVDCQIALCENAIVRYSATGVVPDRQGGRHPLIVPFGPFPTADGHLVIALVKDWQRLCTLLDRPDMGSDPRFATAEARLANAAAVEQALGEALAARTTQAWFDLLADGGAAAVGKVQSIADLFGDPQVAARRMLLDLPLPYGRPGSLAVAGSPLHLSGTPVQPDRTMPELGGDTDRVLGAWASIPPEEIAALREHGSIR
jgi:CoA:oxalate CoA-transferase